MAAVAEVEKLSVSFESASLEDVAARHRKEKKEMQAKIQALKKNAPKNDKKKRKEAMEEVARMEKELEDRQAAELKVAQTNMEPVVGVENGDVDNCEASQVQQEQRVSKAQKRRDKKAREAQEREKEIRSAANEAQFSSKAIELKKICAKLKERQLTLYQIPTDGDCLYNAIRHQVIRHGLGTYSVKELREETANYIIANKDSLICYMTHPKTGDLLNDEEFTSYCEDVRLTHAWGGQIELKALSSILKVPIEVLQSDSPPTVQGDEEFAGPNLIITYHRHMYSLGEHYNSTIPIDETEGDPTEDANEDDVQ